MELSIATTILQGHTDTEGRDEPGNVQVPNTVLQSTCYKTVIILCAGSTIWRGFADSRLISAEKLLGHKLLPLVAKGARGKRR